MRHLITAILCTALLAACAAPGVAQRRGVSSRAKAAIPGEVNQGGESDWDECREQEKLLARLCPKNRPGNFGCPPLMRAAAYGNLDAVHRLLKRGVNVNEAGPLGFTALMVAAGRGHLDVAEALLAAGADPNAAYHIAHVGAWSVLTAAMHRCNQNRLALVDALITAGAKVNPPGRSDIVPLDTAITRKDVPMVKALLERGADVNQKRLVPGKSLVNTPLVTAVSMSEPSVEIVRILLQAGADPNLPKLWVGDEYVSVLSYVEGWLNGPEGGERVVDKAREEIVRLLQQFGAKRVQTPAPLEQMKTEDPA